MFSVVETHQPADWSCGCFGRAYGGSCGTHRRTEIRSWQLPAHACDGAQRRRRDRFGCRGGLFYCHALAVGPLAFICGVSLLEISLFEPDLFSPPAPLAALFFRWSIVS